MSRLVNPANAGSAAYSATLRAIKRRGLCPFCPKHFRWHPEPDIYHEEGWRVVRNAWPYKNARYHFLLIPDQHKTEIHELSERDRNMIWQLELKLKTRFRFKGEVEFRRSGDSGLTGATVRHLHVHLVVPEEGKVVNIPAG